MSVRSPWPVEGEPHVAVVEPEIRLRQAFRRVLERDFVVTDEEDGRALLAKIHDGATFDVILAELSVPGLGGRELLEELQRIRPGLARRTVLMTTSRVDPADWPVPILLKPFTVATMLAVLADVLRGERSRDGT